MHKLLTISFLVIPVVISSQLQNNNLWWHHASIYQIYPRSFQDSNGDGTGDLKGIESRLDYLQELGIDAIWLSPIFKSPMKDFGYDVSDYMDIDPIFGTLEDFQSLLSGAHERSLKVILDFVPNHSSDEHEWFKKSVAKVEPFTDYYVWLDPKGYDEDGIPIPPNNWLSVFRGSAWEFNEERGQFYLHQFVTGQPDLNYRNPNVINEMKNVLMFWLNMGVDGFRMDAVQWIWEDENFEDEPISGLTDDPEDWGYLNHTFTFNLEGTRIVLKEFYDLIKSYSAIDGSDDRINMIEMYSNFQGALANCEVTLPYYECSDFPFNFNFIFDADLDGFVSAEYIKDGILNWMECVPNGKVSNWVLGNHDEWRIGSRTRPELMDAFNLISLTLPGVSVIYNGEEIGMTNTNISWEDTIDPAGCNCGPEHYADRYCSRDPERTPMQWSGISANAGFSTANETWLPVNPNYVEINVETEKTNNFSHWSMFQLLASHKSYYYKNPNNNLIKVSPVQNNVLAFGKQFNDPIDGVWWTVTVVNFNPFTSVVDFSEQCSIATGNSIYIILTTLGENSIYQNGQEFDNCDTFLKSLSLGPNEGLYFIIWTLQ